MKQYPTNNSNNLETRIKIQKSSCKYFVALLKAILKTVFTEMVAFYMLQKQLKIYFKRLILPQRDFSEPYSSIID